MTGAGEHIVRPPPAGRPCRGTTSSRTCTTGFAWSVADARVSTSEGRNETRGDLGARHRLRNVPTVLRSTEVSTPARFLLFGQIGFLAFLMLCAAIDPSGLEDNHGWSYYLGHGETLVPYLLAFATFIAPTLRAARLLDDSSAPRELATGLRYLSFFLVLNLATPDTVDAFFYWAHDVTSALLFLYELGFAIWIVTMVGPRRTGVVLVTAQFAGGLVAMFSQLHAIPLLGPGILLFQVSFGLLLVVATAPMQVYAAGVESTGSPVSR